MRRRQDILDPDGPPVVVWTARIGGDTTALERRDDGVPCWSAELPFGTRSLGGGTDAQSVVGLANGVHRWFDCHGVPADSDRSARLVVHARPRPTRCRIRRVVTPDELRAAADPRTAELDPERAAAAIIVDRLLEGLAVDGARLERARRSTPLRRARRSIAIGAVVMLALATSVIAATEALVSDHVAMAAVTAEGGTLDIEVDSNTTIGQDGPAANWGTFSASVELMKPGDLRHADITLRNPGSLPGLVTVTTTGSDTHADYPTSHCFGFWFRERAGSADVASIGDGTSLGTAGTNAGVVLFHTATGPSQLYVDGASRSAMTWASGEAHTYRLSVRMLDGCEQGGEATAGATGSLTFSFDAVQA